MGIEINTNTTYFSKFFSQYKTHNTPEVEKNDWGGTGSLPKIGEESAHPALPMAQIPTAPRVPEPSSEALNIAKTILQGK